MSTSHKNAYVLEVLSDDHPGIVAAVGLAIDQMQGNIDACSQTVVRGYFTLIMVVSFPHQVEPAQVVEQVHLAHPGGSELQVVARAFAPSSYQKRRGPTEQFVVTCTGPDRPGVVLRFSQYLASQDINIVDLFGERTDGNFVLISQVEIPVERDIVKLQADLGELAREMGFTVRLQHENIFVATNQLHLPTTR